MVPSASAKLSIIKRGPFPKFTSGPKNADAQITYPLPTGDSILGSIPIVSVSHAATLSGYYLRTYTTRLASAAFLTIVVPGRVRFLIAKFTPVF